MCSCNVKFNYSLYIILYGSLCGDGPKFDSLFPGLFVYPHKVRRWRICYLKGRNFGEVLICCSEKLAKKLGITFGG